MKPSSHLKQVLVAITLLAAVSAAFAFSLQPEALDLIALATSQAEQLVASTDDDTKAMVMPLAALVLMGLIAKRRSKGD